MSCQERQAQAQVLEKIKAHPINETFYFWSREDKIQLLKLYKIFIDREPQLYELVYQNHNCDSWEDIFRDYDRVLLADKARGVDIAIDNLIEDPFGEVNFRENLRNNDNITNSDIYDVNNSSVIYNVNTNETDK